MLTGQDIHEAFSVIEPTAKAWHALPIIAKERYHIMALELTKIILEDVVTISSVRCDECGEMLEVEHCEHHACWLTCNNTVPLVENT